MPAGMQHRRGVGSRHKSRQAALQMLYEMDLRGVSAEVAVRAYWGSLAETPDGREFADELVQGCARCMEQVDAAIVAASEHWRLERMSCVDRNILRLGTYELMHVENVPRRVTLNEMIELAKRFGSDESASFINGILDRVASQVGKE